MTTYKYASVRGRNIFYREARNKDAPTIVLLHGFPSSSRMFRDLIPKLSDRLHIIAPASVISIPALVYRNQRDTERAFEAL